MAALQPGTTRIDLVVVRRRTTTLLSGAQVLGGLAVAGSLPAGALIGASLGWGLSYLLSWIGIPMPPPPGMEEGFDAEILVDAGMTLNAFLLAVVTAVLASVIPAIKASRMNIVDALRHQR